MIQNINSTIYFLAMMNSQEVTKAAFTWTQFAYVSKFAYMQILQTYTKVFFTLHPHGFMEA